MNSVKRILVKGCNNLRDLGGYVCKDGISKWHTCYRCDLPLCDQQGFQELYEKWKVHCMIDVRSSAERKMQHYESIPNIEHVHIPFLKEEQVDVQAMHAFQASMAESYLEMCKSSGENIVKILTKIAHATKDGAVLFHCTAGKDRTGIISFFLLSLLGVSQADIMADYQVSSTYNYYGSTENNTLLKQLAQSDNLWMHSQPETLGSLFAYFNEHDIVSFLIKHGMKEEDIYRLRNNFTMKMED